MIDFFCLMVYHFLNIECIKLLNTKDRRIAYLENNLKQEKKLHRICRRTSERRKKAFKDKCDEIRRLKLKQKEKENSATRDKKLLSIVKCNPILLECLENSCKNKYARRYHVSRHFATRQMVSSSSTYKSLRAEGVLGLPHPKTIVRWHKYISILPGFNKQILASIKNIAKTMPNKSKVVAILIDGMAIKPYLDYHAMSDRIHGFPDDGTAKFYEDNKTDSLATEAVVIMIRSLRSKYKQV